MKKYLLLILHLSIIYTQGEIIWQREVQDAGIIVDFITDNDGFSILYADNSVIIVDGDSAKLKAGLMTFLAPSGVGVGPILRFEKNF